MSWSWSQCSTPSSPHCRSTSWINCWWATDSESLSWWQCHRHKELDHQNRGSQHDSLAKKNSSGPAKDEMKQNNKNNNNLKLVSAFSVWPNFASSHVILHSRQVYVEGTLQIWDLIIRSSQLLCQTVSVTEIIILSHSPNYSIYPNFWAIIQFTLIGAFIITHTHFQKIQIFPKFMTEVTSIMAKICIINFWIEWSHPPFWRRSASLTVANMITYTSGLTPSPTLLHYSVIKSNCHK